MADQLPANQSSYQPVVSPYASSSHRARGVGHGLWSHRSSPK